MPEEISEETIAVFASLGVDVADLPDDPARWTEAASDAVFARDATLTARELADRTDSDLDQLLSIYATLGITLVEPDERLFTEADAVLVITLRESTAGPLNDDEGEAILRVVARSLAAIAEAGVAETRQQVERRQTSLDGLARASALMAATGLALGDALGTVFRHHLREAAMRQRRGQRGVESRELIALGVGFVDLVGFTGRSRDMPVEELVEVVSRLDARASELTAGRDVRVVKLIGDEVMFTGVDGVATCAYACDLIDGFGAGARGGIAYGEVLFRSGDYFGPVVNLASRLVSHSVPGEVLVDEAMSALDGVVTQPAGRRMLAGFDEPMPVFSLLRG